MSLKADTWLSTVLGKPAFHLSGTVFTAPDGEAFVDAKVPVDDIAGLAALQACGFGVMDTNVQLTRPGAVMAGGPAQVRSARLGDAAAVKALAAGAFVYDRFHRDPQIGHGVASQLKAEWAGNYFAGTRGDRMIVAEDEQGISGFLQLLSMGGDTIIDLVAVDARCRGKGVARSMIALAAKDAQAMRVGTQIANLPSLALYQRLGFRLAGASYVLHLHLPGQ